MSHVLRFGLIVFLVLSGPVGQALAQSSADPGRIDERVRPRTTEPGLQAPLQLPDLPEMRPSEEGDQPVFEISGVIFEGASSLPEAQLQDLASDYIDREINLSDVYDLSERVTALYRGKGYILSRAVIPAQEINDGFLTIRIVEGFVESYTIQGDAGGAMWLLQVQAQRIVDSRPLTAKVLERELLIASDISGLSVRSVLTPSETTVGAADLTLVVEQTPFQAYVAFDNFSSRYLGREEIIAAGYANDLFGLAGQTSLTTLVTPNKGPELAYGAVSYELPLASNGLSLFTSYSYSRTRPGLELADSNTKGKAQSVRIELSYPFIRSRDFNLTGTLGLYGANISSENDDRQPLYKDKVRNTYIQAFVNGLDSLGGSNSALLTFYQSLPGLGSFSSGDPDLSRVNADDDYRSFNFELTRWQPLVGNFSLLMGAAGQTSFNDDLLASEEWGIGSSFFGRAFDPSEISGEKGLAGMAELQWNTPYQAPWMSNTQLYGFYEAGVVSRVNPLPGEPKTEELVSVGIGVRTVIQDRVNVDLFVAKPYSQDVTAEGDRNARVFFSVSTSF